MGFLRRVVKKTGEDLRLIEVFLVVDPAILRAVTFLQAYYYRLQSVEADALVALCAEKQRLPVFHEQGFLGLAFFLGKDLESAVVENITVLVDLQEGGAFMSMTAFQELLQVPGIAVHAPRHEGGVGPEHQGRGIERVVDASEGGGLGHFVSLR